MIFERLFLQLCNYLFNTMKSSMKLKSNQQGNYAMKNNQENRQSKFPHN